MIFGVDRFFERVILDLTSMTTCEFLVVTALWTNAGGVWALALSR